MSGYVSIPIADKVHWVGALDWGIGDFHGYATERGTTYNAYLIFDEKVTLVDTVKRPFRDEFLSRISSVVPLERIDYIVSNHAEMDHSGLLPELVELVKPEKVFASAAGAKALESHFHWGCGVAEVKTGDSVSLGGLTMQFIETKMLHWPDSMVSYIPELGLMFSQDAFGMHLATAKIFHDENDRGVMHWEAEKYFANILTPYSPRITRLADDLAAMNLRLDIVAPDHGPIWRGDGIPWIIGLYRQWAAQRPSNKVVIVYDTMWGSTAAMTAAFAEGARQAGAEVRVLHLKTAHRSNVAAELLEAGALVLGSPTLNNNLFPSVADIICYLKGLKFQNLLGGAIGSYGWSGESVKIINEEMRSMGIETLDEGVKVKYVPSLADLAGCAAAGAALGGELAKRVAAAGG